MWPIRRADEEAVARVSAEARIAPALARVLWLRGVRDANGVERWLRPSVDHFYPSNLLPDFAPAVARIRRAVSDGEGILIWGHDDLDGMTSVVVLARVLSDMRAGVYHYIPTRGRERHGLNPQLAATYLNRGVRLVITVDCGITNRRQVESLREGGMDVIVTDHHEVMDSIPDAVANVDAKRPDSAYPYRGLAGVGVALKLAMGLADVSLGLSAREFLSVQPQLHSVAVLGTIADRVPLVDENRTLVATGLRSLETAAQPAIRAVLDHLGASQGLTVSRLVADLMPLFASANGDEGVERILHSTPEQARDWVRDLAARSVDWRAEAERTFAIAEQSVSVGDGIVFVRDRSLSLRALGFCASRLKDRYQLPAIVMGWRGDAWVGECRGIDGVSLMDLLSANSRFFIDYGGHKKAAGFSILDEPAEEFVRSAEQYAHENFAGRVEREDLVEADARLSLSEFRFGCRELAPFGEGNQHPLFLSDCERLLRSGDGWMAESRPDIRFRTPHRSARIVPGERSQVLYSVDDDGTPVLVDTCVLSDGATA